jgi:hypothetical protein
MAGRILQGKVGSVGTDAHVVEEFVIVMSVAVAVTGYSCRYCSR